MTQNASFSLIAHAKQLLLVTFCDTNAGIWSWFSDTRTAEAEGQTEVEVEIVI